MSLLNQANSSSHQGTVTSGARRELSDHHIVVQGRFWRGRALPEGRRRAVPNPAPVERMFVIAEPRTPLEQLGTGRESYLSQATPTTSLAVSETPSIS